MTDKNSEARGGWFHCSMMTFCVVALMVALCGSGSASAQDCNANGIPDDCDISCGEPGDPCYVPGCGGSEDCNGNGIPDECEIAMAGPPASGLTLWLRADSGVVLDPGGVVAWMDQSGLGNDFAPVIGYGAPSLITDVLNYNPVVRFDGLDDRLTNAGQLVSGNQFTIFTVLSLMAGDYAWEVGGGYPYRVFCERGAGAGDPGYTGNTLDIGHDNGNDVRVTHPGISAPGFRTLSILGDQTLSGTRVYVNGHPAETQLTLADQTWVLGGGQNNLGWMAYPAFGRADVAEFIIYDRVLTEVERRYVERYLGAKYFGTVAAGDCDGNGVPDECEWVDCNDNGVFDACDIAEGVSADCNGNGVPDECDLAEGTSEDCMDALGYAGFPNGVPDECDLEHIGLVHSRSVQPTGAECVGACNAAATALSVAVAGSLAYVADGYSGVEIINVSDPGAPQWVGRYRPSLPTACVSDVAVDGNYAYLAIINGGFQIVDVSNPVAPLWVAQLEGGSGWSALVAGSYAYVGYSNGLGIIDVSNPVAPQWAAWWSTDAAVRDVAVAGSYAYVVEQPGSLHVLDVSNPNDPWEVGTYDTGGAAWGVALAGSYAYVADGDAGAQIIDISNAAVPVWVGGCDTSGYAQAIAVAGNQAYVADEIAGLQIIDVSEPAAPVWLARHDTSGVAIGLVVVGSNVYVAVGDGGLQIFRTAADPLWSSDSVWCPALVPDNDGAHTFAVTLAGDTGWPITLDISPTVTSLAIENGAALEVNASSGASVRTLAADNPITNSGLVRAVDDKRLVLDAPQLLQTMEGELQAAGASCIQVNGIRVIGGIARATSENARIELLGGAVLESVTISGDVGRTEPLETIRVPGGQYGQIAGTITNTSLVGIGTGPTYGPAFLFADVMGATLSDRGWLRLGNPNAFLFVSGTAFVNGPEHTIGGSGWIFGGPTNLGTIVADRAGESLFLRSGDLISNDGVLAAAEGGTLDIENPISGAGGLDAYAGGIILISDDTAIVLDGAITVRDGGQLRRDAGVTTVTLNAGSLAVLDSTSLEPGTLVWLDGTMVATVDGPVLIDGVQTCQFRGCTPPILHIEGAARLEAQTLDVVGGGELQLDGSARVQTAGSVTLDGGGIIRGLDASGVLLTAGSVVVTTTEETGGQLWLDDDMQLEVAGDLVIESASPGLNRGCTPPILHVAETAHVAVGGAFVEAGAASVAVTALDFEVGGDFDVGSTSPATFRWESGGLLLKPGESAGFEAAGTDRGLGASGWIDNFAFGRLEVFGPGAVEFRDVRDNDAEAQGPCSEAVYVDTLVLRAGARLTLDDCRLYSRHIVDDGALIRTVGCGQIVSASRDVGDLNCDGSIDSFDIDPFILALTDLSAYVLAFPACDYTRADINSDGRIDTFDIDPFVRVITGGCSGRSVPLLLVVCRSNGSVLAYDGDTGQFIRELIPPGGGINDPNQIVAAPDDSFYVASVGTSSVVRFSIRSGQQMLALTEGGLSGPDGIALTTSEVLVASYIDSSVKRFDAFSGMPLGNFVEPHAGGLDGTSGLQLRANGNLLAASQRTNQVLEFDPQGTCLGPAAAGDELHAPYAILLDSQGDLLVGSFAGNAVLRYAPNGDFLGYVAAPGAGGLSGPGGLAELPDGSVLVTSRYNHRILRYSAGGVFMGVFAVGGGLSQPTGMALINVCDVDCNGNGILDRWDIDLGFSIDVDGDAVPDECE